MSGTVFTGDSHRPFRKVVMKMKMSEFLSAWSPHDQGDGRCVGFVSDAGFIASIPDGFTECVLQTDEPCRCWISDEYGATILWVGTVLEVSLFTDGNAFLHDVQSITDGRVTLH